MPLLSRSLYKKILLIMLIVSIVPALIGTLLTYSSSLIAMDSTIGGYLEDRTHQFSKNIETILRAKHSSVLKCAIDPQLLSLVSRLSPDDQGTTENRTLLQEIARECLLEDDILILASPDGAPWISTSPRVIRNFGRESWWKAATGLKPGDVFFAEEKNADTSAQGMILAAPVSFGVSNSMHAAAMFVCIVNLERLFAQTSFATLGEQWTVGVFSSRGNLIVVSDNRKNFLPILKTRDMLLSSRLSAWFPTQEIGNAKHIVAVSTVNFLRTLQREGKSNCEWFGFTAFDVSDVVVFINLLMWRMSLVGLVLVVFLLALGLYLSNKIVKPIKKLHQGILGITAGNLDSTVEIDTGDEIEDLAKGFNDMAEKLKKTYADLENKVREVDEKANQISLIHEITQAINSALDLDRIFDILGMELKRIVDYEYAAISLLGEEGKSVYHTAIFPLEERAPMQPFPLEGTNLESMLESKQPMIKKDLESPGATREDKDFLHRGVRSSVVVPLFSPAGLIGILTLGSRAPGHYGEKELRLLQQVAGAISVAVEHSRLYTRVMRFTEELELKIQERTRELEAANRKFILTEKFAASGKMAASVAHEINNPLGIIKNYLKLFSDQWEKHSARLESLGLSLKPLEIIGEELERIARIVRTLLDIHRPAEGRRVPTDVNRELGRLIELMRKNFERKGIRVILDLDSSLPKPVLSPDLLRQVFLNILSNAGEAMEEKGDIRVQTRFLGAGTIGKKYIEVVVKDTGCGIPPENMGKIFDPFFSTKKEGESTGLGLSVTYSILQTMGGDINIASDPGYGTLVRILLPYSSPEEDAPKDG